MADPCGTVQDIDAAPCAIVWELTSSDATTRPGGRAGRRLRNPPEFTTQDALEVVADLARFESAILILAGDDLMARADLEQIATAARAAGLRVALAPGTTARITSRRLRALRDAGVRRVALRLDGPVATIHDASRGQSGSFARTLNVAAMLREERIPIQINTTVTRELLASLTQMAAAVTRLRPVQWNLTPVVPSRQARPITGLSAAEHEALYHWVYDLSRRAPFDIKVTEAPAYRRVAVQRRREDVYATALAAAWPLGAGGAFLFSPVDPDTAGIPGRRFADGLDRPAAGIGDGKGFLFISHTGDVSPSGFLRLPAGNVRERSVVEIYRDAPLFRALRDPSQLKGRCGCCEFRDLCGGSRARAYAETGDPLASDPSCLGSGRPAAWPAALR